MHTSISRTILCVASCAIGCTSPTVPGALDEPRVEALSAIVSPGSAVTVRLSNPSGAVWYYNLCANSTLQRRTGDAWVEAPTAFLVCTAELSALGPGAKVTGAVYVGLGLSAGTYRVLVSFRRDETTVEPASNAFRVE